MVLGSKIHDSNFWQVLLITVIYRLKLCYIIMYAFKLYTLHSIVALHSGNRLFSFQMPASHSIDFVRIGSECNSSCNE